MRYCDIQPTASHRFRLPTSHPILAEIGIDPADWHDFQRLFADDPVIHILGHETPRNQRMIVHLACASVKVQRRLEDGWC
jgi:hypothetical protein